MKILFISSAHQPDYLCDALYHGLKTEYGTDVESANEMWYMYDTLLGDEKQYLYGRGFTLYGLLNSEIKNVPDVADIIAKISNRFYDYIIYGSIRECKLFFNNVLENYTANKIIFIDGVDRTSIEKDLVKKGLYFKRELLQDSPSIYPISFAIPAENIINDIPVKIRDWAINYPGKLNTYIHKTEESYYFDYKISKFAVTFKKEGWDCLRHYEILANGCLPYFTDLDKCPSGTLVNFPKKLVLSIKQRIENNIQFSDEEYKQVVQELLSYTKENLTTVALANYVLGVAECTNENKTSNKGTAKIITDDEAIIKADFIEKALNKSKSGSSVILYLGLSKVQDLRYLNNLTVYADSIFKSALNFKLPANTKLYLTDDIATIQEHIDVIVLDMTLPYQEYISDYMQKVIALMQPGTRIIITVQNYRSFSTVLGFIKNDLKFGRLVLAKGSQVNFYSKKSLERFTNSYNLQCTGIFPYQYDNSHWVKRMLNTFSFLRYFTCKMLFVEAELKNG